MHLSRSVRSLRQPDLQPQIKVSRLLIIVKSIRREVRKMLHPNAVTIIKVNGKKIGQDTLKNVNLYLTCYIMILIVSILLVSIDNFDFATTFRDLPIPASSFSGTLEKKILDDFC